MMHFVVIMMALLTASPLLIKQKPNKKHKYKSQAC